jgi:hypothetical protein
LDKRTENPHARTGAEKKESGASQFDIGKTRATVPNGELEAALARFVALKPGRIGNEEGSSPATDTRSSRDAVEYAALASGDTGTRGPD